MKSLSHLFSLIFFSLYAHASTTSTLTFSNGDTLKGSLDKITKEQIFFKHKAFKKENNVEAFNISQIKYITFSKNNEFNDSHSNDVHVTMHGRFDKELPRDLYKGSINTVNSDSVILNTTYAGTLEMAKPFVSKLDIFDNNGIILPGLGKLSDWSNNSRSPNVVESDRAFKFERTQNSLPQSIFRKIQFPSKYMVKCSIERNVQEFARYTLILHADKNGASHGKKTTIVITISGNEVRIAKQNQNIGQQKVDTKVIPGALLSQENWTSSIYVDNDKKHISLYINDIKIIDEASLEPIDKESLGDYFCFQTSSSYNPLILNNLQIRQWNGSKPGVNPEIRIPLKEQIGEAIKLQNGDTIYGNIEDIIDGIAKIKTKYGITYIRLNKIASLDLGLEEENEILMCKDDALLTFIDGSSFIITIEKVEGETIWGSSEAFKGTQGFDIKKISRIEFQNSIYL